MNILFAAAEVAPIAKVGGLADVVGALPTALREEGHDVRIILPLYEFLDRGQLQLGEPLAHLTLPFVGNNLSAELFQTTLPGTDTPLYLVDCAVMFHGPTVYPAGSTPDQLRFGIQRFVAFAALVIAAVQELDWQPDIFHAHDWHAALVPVIATVRGLHHASVLTIHNLHNQGVWNPAEVWAWLGWTGQEHPLLQTRDWRGDMNALQLGIHAASVVNTVSPTYAQEILTPEFGEHLQNDLGQHRPRLAGIVNGLDVGVFNPSTDTHIENTYDTSSVVAGKAANKAALQQRLGLAPVPNAPLFVAVSRLSAQKGFDLLPPVIDDVVAGGGQVAILGSGWPEIEGQLHRLAQQHPRAVAVELAFDAGLAQLFYAAGDFFLMPSRFEPCGLGQLIAMRYGTVPIVRDTGGLRDTVINLDQHPDRGTGFVFSQFTTTDFQPALQSALRLYRQPATLQQVIRRAMSQDFSWEQSARRYLKLYAQAHQS